MDYFINDLKKEIVNSVYDESIAKGNNKFFPPESLKQKISLDVDNAVAGLNDLFIKGFNVLYQTYNDKKKNDEQYKETITFLEFGNLLTGEGEIAEEFIEKINAISLETTNSANQLIGNLIEAKKYEDARNALYFLISLLPDFPPLLSNLGFVEFSLGNLEPAVRAYALAYTVNPDDPLPLFHAAYCLNESGEKQEALEYLNHAIEISEGHQEFDEIRQSALELKSFLMGLAA